MAPKAKGGAKAKAGLRRPAGAPRGAPALHRPARRGVRIRGDEPEEVPAEDPGVSRKEGKEVEVKRLTLLDFITGQHIVLTDAVYYGSQVRLAGKLIRLEMEGGAAHLHLQLTGATNEGLLKAHTSDPKTLVMVHLCGEDCSQLETGEHYVHGLKARLASMSPGVEEGWVNNLVGGPPEAPVDELEALRKRGLELGRREKSPKEQEPGELESVSSGKKAAKSKEKKKKKDRKKEKSEEKKHDGKHPVRSSVKSPSVLFAGTGLDTRERVRKRVTKQAKKFLNKRRKKDDSSTTSEGTTSQSVSGDESLEAGGLFSAAGKARSLARRFPGVLAFEAVQQMQEQLLTEAGEDTTGFTTRPISILYYRQELHKKAGGPMARELLNLTSCLDALLRGKVAVAADIVAQRIKACEAVMNGTHWTTAQRLEVVGNESSGIAQGTELDSARKENYEDSKTRYLATLGPGKAAGKGKGKTKSDQKGGKGQGEGAWGDKETDKKGKWKAKGGEGK